MRSQAGAWEREEGRFTLLLVNARHVKHVPGRKTDGKDCQWLAQFRQCGLLQGSFIPDRPQRELRDLTRHRAQLVSERTRVVNRLHKVLEEANMRLLQLVLVIINDLPKLQGNKLLCFSFPAI